MIDSQISKFLKQIEKMTKKIISIVAIIAVLAIGYFAIKNGNIKPANTETDGSATGPSEEELAANLPLPGTDD